MSKLLAKLKGWKTLIVGFLVGLPLAAFEILEQLQVIDVSTMLPPPWGQRLALCIAILMIVLRTVTSSPVGRGE